MIGMLAKLLTPMLLCASFTLGQSGPGRVQFETRCVNCHGGDGNGGELGPAIVTRIPLRDDGELSALIREGRPGRGMPASQIEAAELADLIRYLRSMRPRRGVAMPVSRTINMATGARLEGFVLNEGSRDLQLLGTDKRLHLLRKSPGGYRSVTSQSDWLGYNGRADGNRYTTLDQIRKSNVARLAPKWIFTLPDTSQLEVTPVVVDGVMYVTAANECYALDAGTGRQIWHYRRRRTRGLIGNAAGGLNRGVAVDGDRLFMATDHAHVISLNRFTGELLWETESADWRQNYNSTAAPLVVGDLVISGTAGGDEGVRGFVAAYEQSTGREVWRFWTVPKPGEPGSETWIGKAIEHGAAATWLTGSYDSQLDLVYWTTGNPGPDYDGSERLGDNLYSSSVVALEAKTGKLKWYFQFTPHNLWDWDSTQTPVLVDADWQGRRRKLLLHANRNGFFYVLDRTDGKLLLAKQFIKKLTWAKEIGPDGRPVLNPGQVPTLEGATVCPSMQGATNWFSTAFNPSTGLYYVSTLESCNIFTSRSMEWRAGRNFMAGTNVLGPDHKMEKVLRAIDITTGAIRWELPQAGTGNSWGGVLGTSTGLVFFGEDGYAFTALDALSGKPLWQFEANQLWRGSPMTYVFDHKQHIAVASGQNIISFALVD